MVITIQIWFKLTRLQKKISVCGEELNLNLVRLNQIWIVFWNYDDARSIGKVKLQSNLF